MHSSTSRPARILSLVGLVLITSYATLLAWAAVNLSYRTWAALLWIPLLILATIPMLLRAGRRDPDPRFVRLLVLVFALKVAATVARYVVADVLYNTLADAEIYDQVAVDLALSYRDGNFAAELGREFVGTGFMRAATGVLYAITGPSIYIGFAFFGWLGFWGLYFLYRAFRVGVPDGDARRYAVLIFILPSMLYWPSSIGKEAWMTFGIGLFAYGAALLFNEDRRWPVPLMLGVAATGVVRPHITAALFAAFGVALILRRSRGSANELTPVIRGLAAAMVLVLGLFIAKMAAGFLEVDDLSVSGFDSAIKDTAELTDEGGSTYEGAGVNSIGDLPMAIVTVVFRPFPTEAHNAQSMVAALEGMALMFLAIRSRRRLRSIPFRVRAQPYLLFSLAYSLAFVYAFSNFSNFGILTRERVQVLPFIVLLLALPEARTSSHHRSIGESRTALFREPAEASR